MQTDIENMVDQFESGRLSRRQLVGHLSAFAALMVGGADVLAARQSKSPSTFETIGLHHIALRVTDLDRSQKFYEQHLGLQFMPVPEAPPFMRFMKCPSGNCLSKTHLLNLWKADQPGLHHFCFAVANYNQKSAVEKLQAQRLDPIRRENSNSVYFRDPDGLIIQLGGPDAD